MLVNLGSTAAAGVFATSPRPGVTGTLPVAHGGTGATSAAAARAALGAAAASHSHSYLPLSGGTVTGPITLSYAGCNGSWINGKTNAKIIISDASATDGSKYSPIMMGKTANGDVWNLGHGASDQVGFFGYYKERTENGTDWSHYIKVSDGTVHFGKTVYATTFSGPLSGNASSATTATNATYNYLPRVSKSAAYQPGTNRGVWEEFTNGTSYSLPTNHFYHIFTGQGSDPNYNTQLALGMTINNIAYRNRQGGTWGSWLTILTSSNYKSYCTPANIGAAAKSHTHNYAGASSPGGAATSANKVNVPVGTVLFSTSSSATFFSSCFGGTWTVVGNVDAIVGSSSTLTLYMFRKTAA